MSEEQLGILLMIFFTEELVAKEMTQNGNILNINLDNKHKFNIEIKKAN